MTRAREIPELPAGLPFREAPLLVIGIHADEVWQHDRRALTVVRRREHDARFVDDSPKLRGSLEIRGRARA